MWPTSREDVEAEAEGRHVDMDAHKDNMDRDKGPDKWESRIGRLGTMLVDMGPEMIPTKAKSRTSSTTMSTTWVPAHIVWDR